MQANDPVVTRLDIVPYVNIARILDVIRDYELDVRELLRAAGMLERLDSGKDGGLTGDEYYAFLDLVLDKVDIPAFGLKAGQKYTMADYGVLSYACISSATVRQFLQTFFRYQQLVSSDATFSESMREDGANAIIEIRSQCINRRLYRFDIEEAIGQWCNAAKDLWKGSGTMFSRINLSVSRPGYADEFQELVGCPTYYDQPRNELVFPSRLLSESIEMANELTAQLCEQQCKTILQNLTERAGVVEQVRRMIINQPGQVPGPREIAKRLNLSYRTLRRRLSEEGTTFKAVNNEVKMGMAGEYLRQTGLSTQEVAYLLGYSEASNFHRAFKQWYGKTPGQYRVVD
jgi:AraC-like DNA-binding protein